MDERHGENQKRRCTSRGKPNSSWGCGMRRSQKRREIEEREKGRGDRERKKREREREEGEREVEERKRGRREGDR